MRLNVSALIRRILIGFKKDREQRRTTISLYLNIFLIAIRKFLKSTVFFGVIVSVTYWLGYLVFSLSPAISLKLSIWEIYSDDARQCAAGAALMLLVAAAVLYLNRLHTLGAFVETYESNPVFEDLSEGEYNQLAKLIDAEEILVLERERLIDQENQAPGTESPRAENHTPHYTA